MITIELVGKTELQARLNAMPKKIHDALAKKILLLSLKLQQKVQEKLNNNVLKRRTGNLYNSIRQRLEDSPTSISGIVWSTGGSTGNNPPYARIHEYGGTTPAHEIFPKNARALAFMMNGKQMILGKVNHPGSVIPARPYMHPSFDEMKSEIRSGIEHAAVEGLNAKR